MPHQRNSEETLGDFITEAIRAQLLETHTALPARIDSYDASTQRATVVAELQRETLIDGVRTPISIPPITDVPVQFLRAGGFSITFPVQQGDKCLLVFAERDLSGWKKLGQETVPPEARRHDYSDAIALLGIWPASDKLAPGSSGTSLEIRSDDGQTILEVGPNGIIATTGGKVRLNPNGNLELESAGPVTITRGASELLDLISQALQQIGTTTTSDGATLTNAPAIAALKVLVDAMKA